MSQLTYGVKYSSLNPTTENKRKQIKLGMDEFCTFSWCNRDAWKDFGAFIINSKEDLKFYNGPQFSNNYAQPQYNTSALLEGVTFKTQQIKFKIGVYWIGDEDYREFINWLNPYSIGTLIFTFNPQWGYRVKLANKEDSTRYVVGYELENGVSKRRYYTEMTLTFEVQGEPCAISTQFYEFNQSISQEEGAKIYSINLNPNGDLQSPSDLPMPFKVTMSFTYSSGNVSNDGLSLNILYDTQQNNNVLDTELFHLDWSKDFKDQAPYATSNPNTLKTIWLEYDSESGIIYQKYGDGQYKLLNLWSITDTGSKVLNTIVVRKFLVPGRFNNPLVDMNNLSFVVRGLNEESINANITITMNARTNVI